MAYLIKYKGEYRVKACIDQSTNDFPRNIDGIIETDDLYIPGLNGNQVYHFGRSTLVAYIPSIGRGNNILRGLACELLSIKEKMPLAELYKKLEQSGKVWEIRRTDTEIEFKFNTKNLPLIAKYLKLRTNGANISPFSTRNLPKKQYTIPNDDLEEYRKIISNIKSGSFLTINHITKRYLTDILSKSKAYRTVDVISDMKRAGLKAKEYIHSIGKWEEYLGFLKKNLEEDQQLDGKSG